MTAESPTVSVANSAAGSAVLTLPGHADIAVAPVAFSVAAASPAASVTNSSGATVILVPQPGARGPQGLSGTGARVFGETPAGTQDGINPTFTTVGIFQTGSTSVYRNGLREDRGIHYTETAPNAIAFTTPPLSSDDIKLDYLIA